MAATAKSNNTHYDPRTRLVGAIVLVVIAIIFLPMLFNRPVDTASDESDSNSVVMEITSEGKKVFVSRIAPIEDVPVSDSATLGLTNTGQQKLTRDGEAKKQPGKQADKAPAPEEKKPSSSSAKNTTKQVNSSALIRPVIVAPKQTSQNKTSTAKPAAQTSQSKTTSSPEKTAAAKSAPKGSGWMVQVGSYSKQSNADKAAGKLRAKGYTVHTNPVKTSKGTVIRVWLGPFKEKKTANKIQASVKRSTGMSAIIKTYKN